MPYFTPNVDDLDIDVDDFFYEMSSSEKQEMFDLLLEDGFFVNGPNNEPSSLLQDEFNKVIETIHSNRLRLTNEEDTLLKKIANRF
jgi:hypothetical protein